MPSPQLAMFTQLLTASSSTDPATDPAVELILPLTAEERSRSRARLEMASGMTIQWQLPRGTVLHHGDRLGATNGAIAQVVAAPEPVLQVRGATPLALLRAAYHLGNRHVPLELSETYLQLSADPVLQQLLEQLGLEVTAAIAPFQPEAGAYTHATA